MTGASDRDDDEDGSGGSLSLHDVLACVRKRLWLILGCTAAAAIVSAAVMLSLPNRYEAVATVQIDQRDKKIVAIEGVLSDLKADAATIESEVEIIKSKAVLLRVIDDLDLRRDSELNAPSLLGDLKQMLGLARPTATSPPGRTTTQPTTLEPPSAGTPFRDELLANIEGRLKVQRVRTSLLIEIRFASADPAKAARIATAIADTYVRAQVEAKQRAAGVASSLIEDQLKDLRGKVASAERAVEMFKAENDLFDGDGLLLVDRQVAREMETLVKSRGEATEAKARYEQARRMMLVGDDSDTVAEVLRSHTVRLLRDELTKALRREAELSTKYGPRHPEMQRVAADVAKAQSELNAETAKIIRNLRSEHEVAADRVQQLERGLEKLKGEIGLSKEKYWQLKELQREAQASKQLYEALLARHKETTQTQGFQTADSRIVSAASVPLSPAGPKRTQIVAGASIGGLVLGLALAFLLDLAGSGLRRPEDVERLAEAPVLALVPVFATARTAPADAMRLLREVVAEPSGPLAEAIRELRLSLDRATPREVPRIVLVASALPGEGTTVIAANLALDYALSRRRVLLIDADLRRARLSEQLGLGSRPGLLDVLSGDLAVEQAILHDSVSGLNVLPASSGRERAGAASAALASSHFAAVCARLRQQFDVVVVDAPPLLPVIDARLIADEADQIAFVMAWRRTPKEIARRGLQLLGDNRGKLAGVVMNRVEGRSRPPAEIGIAGDPSRRAASLRAA